MRSNHSNITRLHVNNTNGNMKSNIHSNNNKNNNHNGRKKRGRRSKKEKLLEDNNDDDDKIYDDIYSNEYNDKMTIVADNDHVINNDNNNNNNNIYIDNDDDDDNIIDIEFDNKDDKKDKKEKSDCEILWENLEWDINNEDEKIIDKYIAENINGCKEYIETNFKLDNNDNLIQKSNTVPIGIHMLNSFAIKYPPACQCIKETLKSRKRKPTIGSNVLELLTFRGGPDEESHAIIQSRANLVRDELEKKYYQEYFYDYENELEKEEKAIKDKLRKKLTSTPDVEVNSDDDNNNGNHSIIKKLENQSSTSFDKTESSSNLNNIAGNDNREGFNFSPFLGSESEKNSNISNSLLSIPPSIITSSWPMLKKYYNNDKEKNNNDNNNNYLKDRIYIPPKLGKRGRPYKDMWDEVEAISQNKLPFTPVKDFSEFLNSYCDNYDGSYREYMLNMIDNQVRDELKKSVKKRSHVEDTLLFIKPPVPVAQHHPAAWGLNCRRDEADFLKFISSNIENNNEKYNSDNKNLPKSIYEHIHPACTSKTVIVPSSSLMDHNEDCDELNLAAEYCNRELLMQETLNIIRLDHLKRTSAMMSKITKVRNRKQMMSEILNTAMKIIDSRDDEIVPFPYIYFPSSDYLTSTTGNIDSNNNDSSPSMKNSINNEDSVVDNKNRYSTRTSSGSIRPKKKPDEYENNSTNLTTPFSNTPLGSCLIEHIPYGSFVMNLKPKDQTEVLIKDIWCMGIVKKIQKDNSMILRHIKVIPLHSHPSESVWVCVDDGRLAPPGTYINNIFSKYLNKGKTEK